MAESTEGINTTAGNSFHEKIGFKTLATNPLTTQSAMISNLAISRLVSFSARYRTSSVYVTLCVTVCVMVAYHEELVSMLIGTLYSRTRC
jgi:hypothetical protein